jgi:hypothetical protein
MIGSGVVIWTVHGAMGLLFIINGVSKCYRLIKGSSLVHIQVKV